MAKDNIILEGIDNKGHDFIEIYKSFSTVMYHCKICKTQIQKINICGDYEWEIGIPITNHVDKSNKLHWFNIDRWPDVYLECFNFS